MNKTVNGTYYLVSLGCAKNLVDSNSMAQLMHQGGLLPKTSPDESEFLIVNTCGFLKTARQEAIEIITELANNKLPWQKLIVAGCMPELHRQEVIDAVPGIDGMLGTQHWMDILNVIQKMGRARLNKPHLHFPTGNSISPIETNTRQVTIQGGSAYLKIADGCRRKCSYCLIPMIKGPLQSRPMRRIINDAKYLQDMGIQEIILIAQDTTDYGHDFGMHDGLPQLLENLIKAVPAVPWIRIMYAFPGYISENLIELMRSEPQVLPYLDLPLQHIDPLILRSMKRPSNTENVLKLLLDMRTSIKDLALRTTLIVGYPGETEQSYQKLIGFIKSIKFDHLGAFTYSFEHGAPAEPLGDPIPNDVKEDRRKQVMQIQADISLKRNRHFIGKTLDVLIEGFDETNKISIGRSYRDAPEIDGLVFAEGVAPVGQLIRVKITDAITHDLIGKIV